MFRFTLILIMLLTSSCLGGDAESAITRVDLRATVRLPADQSAPLLGDLARIEGAQRSDLASLRIELPEPLATGSWSQIEMTTIREQIKQAPGINFGAVIVSGCDVRLTRLAQRDTAASRPLPEHPTQLKKAQHTLRQQVERWTRARLDIDADQSRFRFSDRDQEALNTTVEGRVVEIREIGRSERMVLGVVVYEQERVVLDRTLQFELHVERAVRVATTQIKRSSMISNENSKIEHRWLGITEPIAEPDRSIGMITTGTIDPGSMIYASNLEAPILVERGQVVNARSIAGSVSVSLLVRAKESGRLGDIIKLESRDRSQQFQARVAGPGRVVIMHTPTAATRTQPNRNPS
ncbi:MAG: flagellar basal body P-ring formation protein FlgA [Phycisphaerales bacterium]|nr:flagellar basal body P-ring formation protein FlgA [Phycisphaerales bacterium]